MRFFLVLSSLTLLTLPSLTFAQTQTVSIRPADFATGDRFGSVLDLADSQLLASARVEPSGTASRVYLFDATTGAELWRVDEPEPGQLFGSSLALGSQFAFVGAPGTQVIPFGNPEGRVYAYERATGALAFTIESPSPASSLRFGDSLALTTGTLCVGAPLLSTVYLHDSLTGIAVGSILRPGGPSFSGFGGVLDASGSRLAVGETDTGATSLSSTYLFETNGTPTLVDAIAGGLFSGAIGFEVAVNSTDFAGLSFQFQSVELSGPSFAPGNLTLPSSLFARDFGQLAAIALNDSIALIGGVSEDLFVIDISQVVALDPTTGEKLYELHHPDPPQDPRDSEFGSVLALDGSLAAVADSAHEVAGAANAGTVYVYDTTPQLPLLTEVAPYAFPGAFLPSPQVLNLALRAADTSAGDVYFLLASLSGTTPGVVLDGLVLPLNVDNLTLATVNQPNTAALQNTFGTFSTTPLEASAITIPGLLLPGTEINFAFLTVEPTGIPFVNGVSKTVTISIQ